MSHALRHNSPEDQTAGVLLSGPLFSDIGSPGFGTPSRHEPADAQGIGLPTHGRPAAVLRRTGAARCGPGRIHGETTPS